MSVNLSVSNKKQHNCKKILDIFSKNKIDCRIIETCSIINNSLEKGCLITLENKYNETNELKNIWKLLQKDYNCAHLLIHDKFDGCIHDYLK